MVDTMSALVVEEFGKVAFRPMPKPEPAAGRVLVKVRNSGVSIGTEMLHARGKHGKLTPPFVAGYQASGTIADVGEGVSGFEVGDPVAIFCRGSHAEYASTTPELAHKLASDRPMLPASLFVQPAVGANALDIAQVASSDTVLVVGQGLIGQALAQLARLRGSFVVASDISAIRLDMARTYCADWVLDSRDGPIASQTAERFPKGFDVVFETTGADGVLDDALACCRRDGRFSFVGVHPGMMAFPFLAAHQRQIRAQFPVFIGERPVREGVLRLIESGALNYAPLIDRKVHFSEAIDLYRSLLTPARDDVNAISISWSETA